MALFKSLAYSFREARFNPVTVVHSLLYAATITYLKVLSLIVRSSSGPMRDYLSESYHGKVVRLADAGKIVTINRNIELRNLDQVIPYRHARDLVLINPHNIVVYECPCRAQKENPCRPTEVCLIVGEPFTDLLRMVQPFRSRRISSEDALRILREEDERGHVHTAWFKSAMIDRFYAICNCCSCCCLGMKFMAEHGMKMLLPSGYRASVGQACVGCGVCRSYCQFGALTLTLDDGVAEDHRMGICVVDAKKCFGCGVCESKCPRGCISLLRDPAKGIPLDIEALTDQQAAAR